MRFPVIIELCEPISGPDGATREVRLRQPTAGDMADLGFPLVRKNSGVFPRCEVVLAYIERLCGIKRAELRKLSHVDFGKCMEAVILMFDENNCITRPKRWR